MTIPISLKIETSPCRSYTLLKHTLLHVSCSLRNRNWPDDHFWILKSRFCSQENWVLLFEVSALILCWLYLAKSGKTKLPQNLGQKYNDFKIIMKLLVAWVLLSMQSSSWDPLWSWIIFVHIHFHEILFLYTFIKSESKEIKEILTKYYLSEIILSHFGQKYGLTQTMLNGISNEWVLFFTRLGKSIMILRSLWTSGSWLLKPFISSKIKGIDRFTQIVQGTQILFICQVYLYFIKSLKPFFTEWNV